MAGTWALSFHLQELRTDWCMKQEENSGSRQIELMQISTYLHICIFILNKRHGYLFILMHVKVCDFKFPLSFLLWLMSHSEICSLSSRYFGVFRYFSDIDFWLFLLWSENIFSMISMLPKFNAMALAPNLVHLGKCFMGTWEKKYIWYNVH